MGFGSRANFSAQRQALNQTLQSYGINPGDPKYAGALAASRTAQGAAEAAAGQTANRADVAMGNQLKQQALQDTYQNTASGANILGTSQGYAGEGVQNVKFAPLGNASQSRSQSYNQSQSSSPYGGGGGGGGSPGGGSQRQPGGSGGGGAPRSSGGGSSGGIPGGGQTGGGTSSDPSGYGGGGYSRSYYTPGQSQTGNPYSSANGGGGYYSNAGSANPTGDNGTSSGGYGNYPSSANGGGGYYSNAGSANPTGDNGTSSGGYGNYAGGGEVGGGIPDGTTGGHVDRNLSPSQGAIQDDVPARLNAEEFVVPRDVARWKGEEFFHKLIAQSRQGREGVTAKPEQKPMQLKDAVATMRGGGFQSKPVSQAFAGGAIPDGSGQALMQRSAA